MTGSGAVLRAGAAVLFILEELGWAGAARIGRLPFLLPLVEMGYGLVARHRHFFSRFLFRKE